MRDLIADDRVFCYIGNTSNTGVDATRWVSAGPILSDFGKRPVMSIDLSVPTGWMQTFVSKSCKTPELVARFFDYMTSDEGLLYSNYGVQNEDYTFDSDGYIHRLPEDSSAFMILMICSDCSGIFTMLPGITAYFRYLQKEAWTIV